MTVKELKESTKLYEELLKAFKKRYSHKVSEYRQFFSTPFGTAVAVSAGIAAIGVTGYGIYSIYKGAPADTSGYGSIDPNVQGNLIQLVLGSKNYRVSSKFNDTSAIRFRGHVHKGTDIAVSYVPLYAPYSGRITEAGTITGGGLAVYLESLDGNTRIITMHMSRLAVHPGQQVSKGQCIGVSGNTGKSTGAHLHLQYERKINGHWVSFDAERVGTYNSNYYAVGSSGSLRLSDRTMLKNRGARDFNPFSVKWNKNIHWEGQTGQRTGFVTFSSAYAGVRAGMKNIYAKRDSANTINKLVNVYAPESDGNIVVDYKAKLSKALGVGINQPLNFSDKKTLKVLSAAIAKIESGSDLSDSLLEQVATSILSTPSAPSYQRPMYLPLNTKRVYNSSFIGSSMYNKRR